MNTIYKYPVYAADVIAIPHGAKFLSVQVQHGEPQMWFLVDPHQPTEKRHFAYIGTGHQIDPCIKMQFLGTFQMDGGALVFHLFELR